jgi:sigma-B regulation protein RsbU (phosphoserine phosphatase)
VSFQVLVASVYLVCGATLLFLGGVILKENPKSRVNRATSFMLFSAGLAPLLASLGTFIRSASQADSFVSSPFTQNIFYVWEFFFPFLLLFSMVFPTENRYLSKYPKLRYFIFVPHVFHMLLVLIFYQPEKIIRSLDVEKMGTLAKFFFDPISLILKYAAVFFGIVYDIHVQSFSLINLIFLILAVWLLHRGYKRLTVPTLKKQVGFLIWGIRSSVGLYACAFIIPALTPIDLSENLRHFLTVVALVLGSGSIAWAIVKHHFLDVKLIVRQSLVYFLTTALFVGLYFLILRQFGRLMQGLIGKETPAIDVGFVILAIILFQPIMGQLDDLIKKFFIRERSDYRAMMETFSRKLVTIFEFDALKETVMDTLKKEMLVENVYICTCQPGKDEKSHQYALFSDDSVSEMVHVFDESDPLLLALREKTRPTPFTDFRMVEHISPFFKELEALQTFLVVPLISQKDLVGCIGLSKKTTRFRYSYEDITLLDVLANQMVVAMNNARLYQESLEKQRLEEELNLARQIQIGLLPKTCPRAETFEFSAFMQPARLVGGDYYDFLRIDSGSIGVAIADASGKGIPAALLMSLVHASLRAEVRNKLSPQAVISSVNQLIHASTTSEKFATMFYGELDPREMKLCYCNAGHNYPLVVHGDGQVESLEKGGLILGAFPEAAYEAGEVVLRKNDTLFFYSDGLTENFNSNDEEFGEERLLSLLVENRFLGAEELKEKVMQTAVDFAGGHPAYDDLTIVVLKIH